MKMTLGKTGLTIGELISYAIGFSHGKVKGNTTEFVSKIAERLNLKSDMILEGGRL